MISHTRAITEDEVDARVEQWHNLNGSDCPLHTFLGWTEPEYARWVETCEIPSPPVTLTRAQANDIADTLLAGCFALTEVEHSSEKGSLARASAENTFKRLRDAMLLLEGRIAQ